MIESNLLPAACNKRFIIPLLYFQTNIAFKKNVSDSTAMLYILFLFPKTPKLQKLSYENLVKQLMICCLGRRDTCQYYAAVDTQ